MRKGITPIISIIILLLITIALAGAAYSYLSTYFTGTTGKSIQLIDSYCGGGRYAVITIQNLGTQSISFGTTCLYDTTATGGDTGGTITGTTATCSDLTITRQDGSTMDAYLYTGPQGAQTPTSIDPQEMVIFNDTTCTGFCQYRFLSEGAALGALVAQVSC